MHQERIRFRNEGFFPTLPRADDARVRDEVVNRRTFHRVRAHAKRDEVNERRGKRGEIDIRKVVGSKGMPWFVVGRDNDISGRLQNEETKAETTGREGRGGLQSQCESVRLNSDFMHQRLKQKHQIKPGKTTHEKISAGLPNTPRIVSSAM